MNENRSERRVGHGVARLSLSARRESAVRDDGNNPRGPYMLRTSDTASRPRGRRVLSRVIVAGQSRRPHSEGAQPDKLDPRSSDLSSLFSFPALSQDMILRCRPRPISTRYLTRSLHSTPLRRRELFDPNNVERASDEVDVCIVGGGPAGLSAAIRLKQLEQQRGREVRVVVLEKGAEVGEYCEPTHTKHPSHMYRLAHPLRSRPRASRSRRAPP